MDDEQKGQFSIIDHIYQLQDRVTEEIDWLRNNQKGASSDIHRYGGIMDAVVFLDEQGVDGRLGLSDMELS